MISEKGFNEYSALINDQARAAMDAIRAFSMQLSWGSTRESRGWARELLADYAYDVVSSYGDNAAEIAAEYYDELASLAGARVPRAILADAPTREGVSASVSYQTRGVWDVSESGALLPVDSAAVSLSVAQMAAGRVRTSAHETMYSNSLRNGNRFARVTTSSNPCAFCVMLASHGFTYLSEQSAIMTHNMRKYHDDCSCIAVSAFDDEGLEGHHDDADGYYELWDGASRALPDKDTRAAWNAMGKAEQAKWTRTDHPTWYGYANYRTHALLSKMRSMYGLKS